MPKVYVELTADFLHPGHINVIKIARNYGDVIVGLLTDDHTEPSNLYITPPNPTANPSLGDLKLTAISAWLPTSWNSDQVVPFQRRITPPSPDLPPTAQPLVGEII